MGVRDSAPRRPAVAAHPTTTRPAPVTAAFARDFIRRHYRTTVATERVPLLQAQGRILFQDLVAPMDLPPHDSSAVDGYAFNAADLRGTSGNVRALPIVGLIVAGHPLAASVAPGRAVRVFTGGQLPQGVDTVAMQEHCETTPNATGGGVILPADLKPGANVRRRGEDVAMGAVALKGGRRLRAGDVALAAALGQASLPVMKRLRVALVSTGDELSEPGGEPGAPREAGRIWDANRPMLRGLLEPLGCDVTDLGILPDHPEKIVAALVEAAQNHDLIVASGGMSVGDEDYMTRTVRRRGSLDIWQIKIKPGKPIGLGDIDDCPILALPGNPVAVAVTFLLFGTLLIARLSGNDLDLPQSLRLACGQDIEKRRGRAEYLPASLATDPESGTIVTPSPKKGSAMLSALVGSDGLIALPENCQSVGCGEMVEFIPFRQPMFG